MINPNQKDMIQLQLVQRGITDKAVLRAMATVPREKFISAELKPYAYEDRPLPIEENQTISQPYIVALMLQLLSLKPHFSLLDIGTGSGYAAAVASHIVSEVYSVECYFKLLNQAQAHFTELNYSNIHCKLDDGYKGWKEHAPYDAIQVAAASSSLTQLHQLQKQLKIGGKMVVPIDLEESGRQQLFLIERISDNEYRQQNWGDVRFVPLIHIK